MDTCAPLDLEGLHAWWTNYFPDTHTPTQANTHTHVQGDMPTHICPQTPAKAVGVFDWLQACAQFAAGRVEYALAIFTQVCVLLSNGAPDIPTNPATASDPDTPTWHGLSEKARALVLSYVRLQRRQCELILSVGVDTSPIECNEKIAPIQWRASVDVNTAMYSGVGMGQGSAMKQGDGTGHAAVGSTPQLFSVGTPSMPGVQVDAGTAVGVSEREESAHMRAIVRDQLTVWSDAADTTLSDNQWKGFMNGSASQSKSTKRDGNYGDGWAEFGLLSQLDVIGTRHIAHQLLQNTGSTHHTRTHAHMPTKHHTQPRTYSISGPSHPFMRDLAHTLGLATAMWGDWRGIAGLQQLGMLTLGSTGGSGQLSRNDLVTVLEEATTERNSNLNLKAIMWSTRMLSRSTAGHTRSSVPLARVMGVSNDVSSYGGINTVLATVTYLRNHGNPHMALSFLSRFRASAINSVSAHRSSAHLPSFESGTQSDTMTANVNASWLAVERARALYDVGRGQEAVHIVHEVLLGFPIDVMASRSMATSQKLRFRVRTGDNLTKDQDRLKAAVLMSLAQWLDDGQSSYTQPLRQLTAQIGLLNSNDWDTTAETSTPPHPHMTAQTHAQTHTPMHTYMSPEVIRSVLSFAAHLSPADADIRFAYASHCFALGKHAVEHVHTRGNRLVLGRTEWDALTTAVSGYLSTTTDGTDDTGAEREQHSTMCACTESPEAFVERGDAYVCKCGCGDCREGVCTTRLVVAIATVLQRVEWSMADQLHDTDKHIAPVAIDTHTNDTGKQWRITRKSLQIKLHALLSPHAHKHKHMHMHPPPHTHMHPPTHTTHSSTGNHVHADHSETALTSNGGVVCECGCVHMCVDSLVCVRDACITRTLSPLARAAAEYFTYLQITAGGVGGSDGSKNRTADSINRMKPSAHLGHTGTQASTHTQPNTHAHANANARIRSLVAPLRLLKLLVHFGPELAGVMTDGLETTPWVAWAAVVPQLLAQFSHPEQYVCDRIVALISRIGLVKPQAVVFAALAGAWSSRQLSESVREQFEVVVQSLRATHGSLVSGVETLMHQLAGLSQLPEERWRSVLGRLARDVAQRIHRLKSPLHRIAKSTHIGAHDKITIAENQCKAVLDPLVHELERLRDQTFCSTNENSGHTRPSYKSQSNHDRHFAHTYRERIESALQTLSFPCGSAVLDAAVVMASTKSSSGKISSSAASAKSDTPTLQSLLWGPFNDILESLNGQIRSSDRTRKRLKLADIAPGLVQANLSAVYLPLDRRVSGASLTEPSIYRFVDEVEILPTNTRPKKIKLWGSDGALYTYLYKGVEDMHLDQRIMQFLRVVNTLLGDTTLSSAGGLAGRLGNGSHGNEQDSLLSNLSSNLLYTNTYAVTPLGERCGLIQWVDGAVPLYSLYRRFQQRGIACGTIPSTAALRPSEQFWSLVGPALDKSGTSRNKSRDKWPQGVLYNAFCELAKTVPDSLVHNEMFTRAATPADWRRLCVSPPALHSLPLILMTYHTSQHCV
ncbi:hypothetical protein SARC_03639 [Sphaeroforma arctica JP610]|uniref:PI3K/PI4K catalytic domain-containing protein n=1 Tax=Sphaeroforma arctica JP610 TaxID=667725 RepID=A0A0L0G5P5_9EUKA|nr:hypothetical protein SARC_03639 [Sphaeroforma arctica JP610]KNC84141.1 hypothetical protein SARC_03639 [Sphaeroforma arctica JP610]|eukprot:XP_014158043.1 hypothetical protein SARC_03639 [Sphaeroforma arctica JP610]